MHVVVVLTVETKNNSYHCVLFNVHTLCTCRELDIKKRKWLVGNVVLLSLYNDNCQKLFCQE